MPKISYIETLKTNPNLKAAVIRGGAYALLKEVSSGNSVSSAEVGSYVLGQPYNPGNEKQINVGRVIAAMLGDIKLPEHYEALDKH